MSLAGNLWNKLNNAYRELIDSSTISWDFTTNRDQASASLVDGSITTAKLGDDQVTYAKMQNVSATSRILGRKTAAAGDVEECTLSQVLDFVGSAADGDILIRSGGAWTRLAKGSDTNVLTLASGLPSWAAPASPTVAVVTAGALSSQATLDISVGSTYDMYEIDLIAVAPATDNQSLYLRLSQSASFLSGASDYSWGRMDSATLTADEADAQIIMTAAIGNATNEHYTGTVRIFRPGVASFIKTCHWRGLGRTGTPSSFSNDGGGTLLANSDAIDGVRFLFASGNIASGYYAVRGYRFA